MDIRGNLKLIGGGYVANLRPEPLAADPATPEIGQIWFNTTEGVHKSYDGVTITTIASGGSLNDYINRDGSVAMTAELSLFADATSALGAVPKQQLDAAVTALSTSLAGKQDTITGAATSITSDNLAADLVLVSDVGGKVGVSAVTSAELSYLSGATSSLQTQIDGKQATLGFTPVNRAGDTLTGDLSMGNFKLTNLAAPTDPLDAVNLITLQNSLSGLDFQGDVLAIQADNTLDPGATPATGDRYIINDSANLHANFGAITGVEDGDIVQYDGAAFVVAYDVSVKGEGALVWDRASNSWYNYTSGWNAFGGMSSVNPGEGIGANMNTFNINRGAGIGLNAGQNSIIVDNHVAGGLILVDGAYAESTDVDAQLGIKLQGTTLALSNDGLAVGTITAQNIDSTAATVGNGLTGGGVSALSVMADAGITVSATGVALDQAFTDSLYLGLGGGTLTGSLVLAGDAVAALEPTTKQQVDASVTAINDAITALDTRINTLEASNKFGQFDYDGLANSVTTHTITHNLNNKYVQVTVVDAADNVVIPDSIIYTDANNLNVVLGAAAGIRGIVMGRIV